MKVILTAAMTADGLIARHENHLATTWTTGADKKHITRISKEYGVVIMGLRTFKTINKPLRDRHLIVYSYKPGEEMEGVEYTSKAPTELLKQLEKEGHKGAVIWGGASIYNMFMAAGLVDEIYITIVAKMFGKGMTLFNESLDIDLELLDSEQLDPQTIILHYKVLR